MNYSVDRCQMHKDYLRPVCSRQCVLCKNKQRCGLYSQLHKGCSERCKLSSEFFIHPSLTVFSSVLPQVCVIPADPPHRWVMHSNAAAHSSWQREHLWMSRNMFVSSVLTWICNMWRFLTPFKCFQLLLVVAGVLWVVARALFYSC